MTAATVALPSSLGMGLNRGRVELKEFFRQRDAVIFTLALPAVILILLGSIFNAPADGLDLPMSQVLTAGLIAYGIIATAFTSVGVGIASDRDDGTLKRLRGTPATATSYFLGKVILVGVATLLEVVVLIGVGMVMFDLSLPTDAARWGTFAWLLALSVLACTLLGIAASSLASSARSAPAVLNLPVLVLQFISGTFVYIGSLPDAMIRVASLFPVKWMGQGFRSVFLPDYMAAQEAAGAWEHGMTALVLGAWCVIGLVLCRLTFRWTDRS